MKSYDELKAEMETIQQQMAEAKKNERTNALKEVKRLCSSADGRKPKREVTLPSWLNAT